MSSDRITDKARDQARSLVDSLQSDRAVARALAILTICTTLVVNKGEITGSDGLSMYDVGTSLADSGSLAVPPVFGVPGRHGLYYSRYGIGLPLVAAVAYALVKPLAGLGRDPDVLGVAAAAAMMPVIFGLLVAAIYRLSRRLGAGTRAASLAALGAVGGTYLLAYSKEFFSEPLTALCLIVSIEQALADAGAKVIGRPTRTPWNSLNSRLEAPASLQITLFTELRGGT